ncbi:hypothetical protein J4N37_23720 [Vibrio sp. SCSIO 43153]|uniref:hypothetical protein n=1 Tax=Vibrio sp. SCSIO 43153 TaxID=2819098 RepID=UPI00207655BB|nr:hypothetical protein [Vibrio sp. SCSIO 43153]USD52163.1 hypothetical protein J4N37_23720 [Vibrio sp. SCSIO 43153]
MPRASLEFAATLHQEQNELLESMRDDDDSVLDAIYDAQKRYDDYVRKLSTQPEIVAAVPSFVNDRYNAYFQAAAWHVVYLSQNTDVLDQMFMLEYAPGDAPRWTDHRSFHFLEDKEADFIINYLKTKGEKLWLHSVSNYISRNRRAEHLELFVREGQYRFPSSFWGVGSYFHTAQSVQLIKELDQASETGIYIRDLLLLQQPEVWERVRTREEIESDFGDTLARYGTPDDLDLFTQFIDATPVGLRFPYLDTIVSFGNLRALTWLFTQLKYSDAVYRAICFQKMCEFFPEELDDDPDFEDILEVYEDTLSLEGEEEEEWEDRVPEPEYLQSLWVDVQSNLLAIRDINKRYDGAGECDHEFDLLYILRTNRYNGIRSRLNSLFNQLIIYTGQYFPFDCDAYMEKQDTQIDVWEKYLVENREKYLPGRWVRWGEYID